MARLVGFSAGRPVYSTVVPWGKALARLVGFAGGRPVYAAADCAALSTSVGSSVGSSGSASSGSASSGSASGSTSGSQSQSLPSLGSSVASGSVSSGSGSASLSESLPSLPSLGSSVPSGSGSLPSGSVPSGSAPSGSLPSGSLPSGSLTTGGPCPCPPNEFLYATFGGALAPLGTVTLGTVAGAWVATVEGCGGRGISFQCDEPGVYTFSMTNTTEPVVVEPVSCEPFQWEYAGDNSAPPCAGAWSVVITETPP